MGKKKTRSEKKIADLRRKLTTAQPQQPAAVETKKVPAPEHFSYSFSQPAKLQKISTQGYAYVLHDLRKTLYVTGAILIAQCLLYFLLTSHTIKFFVQY